MKTEDRLLDALALAEGEADDLARARVEADPALRAELGAGARATIEEKGYTWMRNAERVEALAREAGARS